MWILIATWLQLGPQLGGQKRDPGSIFSNLTYFSDDETWGPLFITPLWALRPSGINFLSIFDQFLIDFCFMFDRFWTLVLNPRLSGWLDELFGLVCLVHCLLHQAQWRNCRRHLDNEPKCQRSSKRLTATKHCKYWIEEHMQAMCISLQMC